MSNWIVARVRSFRNAFAGLFFNLWKERNFQVQLFIAILVVSAGFLLSIERSDWMIVILTIGVVLSAEIMNTSVEKLCDLYSEKNDPKIRIIKDSAAAAVLLVSAAALIIGVVVFLPYLLRLLGGVAA